MSAWSSVAVGAAGEVADRLQDRLEQVGVVVRGPALDDRGDALEAHAGVDRARRQRLEDAALLPVELHEHVVPDLDQLIVGRHVVHAAAVVEDLGAAAARAGLAHLPEVVGGAELVDAPLVAEDALPDGERLVVARRGRVAGEDRGAQPILGQAPDLGQHRPREPDRVFLEVVAEREVAEHLEERVVPVRRPDVVEIVVLAADAHALLRGRGAAVVAALAAQEHVLELVHPRVGEQQGGVVGRDQRRAGSDAVVLRLEELQEGAPDLSSRHADTGHPDIMADSVGTSGRRRAGRRRACRRPAPRAR